MPLLNHLILWFFLQWTPQTTRSTGAFSDCVGSGYMETWGHSGFRFLTEGPHRVDLFAFYSFSHLIYWNENTTCLKYLFHSSWSTPWATKLPNVAVCTLSFPTSPFLKETTVFLSRHLAERRDEAKRGWWGQELPAEAQDEWQASESIWEEDPADSLL